MPAPRTRGVAAIALTVFASLAPAAALAHVVLERPEAVTGKAYKAVFKVGHGCEGSPTVRLTIDIPEGVIAVKPMPKHGWTVETKRSAYARSYAFYHGKTLAEGATQVTWSGGPLLDEHYDEFVLSAFIAKELEPGAVLYFRAVQTCQSGEHRWVEIPAASDPNAHLGSPAATLKLLPAEGGHSHH
jgi:hypothetical protein